MYQGVKKDRSVFSTLWDLKFLEKFPFCMVFLTVDYSPQLKPCEVVNIVIIPRILPRLLQGEIHAVPMIDVQHPLGEP